MYHYRVKSQDGAGNLTVSGDNTFTTAAAPTPSPSPTPTASPSPDTTAPIISGVTESVASDGAVIRWTTDESATSRIDYGTSPASLTQSVASASLVTNHSLTITGLTKKTTYYYRITSRDAADNAGHYPSSTGTDSFKTSAGAKISGLQATKGSIRLSWQAHTDPEIQSILIYRSTNGYPDPTGTPLAPLPASATSYRDAAVSPGTTYYYTVVTRDTAGELGDAAYISYTASSQGTSLVPQGSAISFTRTLSTLMRGADVKALQQFLISQGLLPAGNDTGYFGIQTFQAVKQFQCDQTIVCSGTSKLTGWGMVGPRTQIRIRELTSGLAPSDTQTPASTDVVQSLQAQLAALLQQLAALQGR